MLYVYSLLQWVSRKGKKNALEKWCEKEKSHCLLVQYLSNITMSYLCAFLTLWSCSWSSWVVLGLCFCSTARRRDLLQRTKPKAPVVRKREFSSPSPDLGKDWQMHCSDISIFPWFHSTLDAKNWIQLIAALLLKLFVPLICVLSDYSQHPNSPGQQGPRAKDPAWVVIPRTGIQSGTCGQGMWYSTGADS